MDRLGCSQPVSQSHGTRICLAYPIVFPCCFGSSGTSGWSGSSSSPLRQGFARKKLLGRLGRVAATTYHQPTTYE